MNESVETPNAAEESTSLADHESAFSPTARTDTPAAPVPESESVAGDDGAEGERERGNDGRFKPRHKAESQRATAADVELINTYTKRLREAEDALGVTIEKKPGESERVFQLRRRAELAEIRRDSRKQEPTPTPAPVKREAPKPFEEKEPQYEDFANEPDQYQAHLRALTAYDRRKEVADGAKTNYETTEKAEIDARNNARDAWFKDQESKHLSRMKAYHDANPDAQAKLEAAGDIWLTPAMYAAVMTADNSPDLLMRVAQDQDLRDDLIDLTEGKSLSKELVERVQRRLNRGVKAADTGSAAPPQRTVPAVPRPPNPVRTGPMKADDTPPGDEGNLADHEKFYGSKRR